MTPKSEKDKLLASVGSPEEWDCFLNHGADFHAPQSSYEEIPFKYSYMAREFQKICPGLFFDFTPRTDFVDIAIARLEAAGIWEGE